MKSWVNSYWMDKAEQLERELAAQREAREKAEETEQARWQEAIYDLCCKRCPDASIDGKGCDSGDPLDFSLAEIGQALCHWIDRAEQAEARLAEAMSALDAAGCPIGNEHKTYSIVERIAGLHKTRDYAWKQMDEGRVRLAEAIKFIERIRDMDPGRHTCHEMPQTFEAKKFLSSTEPPALLKEVEELRKRIHELQGVPFSDRNYGAMRDKLETIRTAAKVALEDVYSHKTNDKDGNHICWLGETSFLLVEKALEKIK